MLRADWLRLCLGIKRRSWYLAGHCEFCGCCSEHTGQSMDVVESAAVDTMCGCLAVCCSQWQLA